MPHRIDPETFSLRRFGPFWLQVESVCNECNETVYGRSRFCKALIPGEI
jgi:hypothetical protein